MRWPILNFFRQKMKSNILQPSIWFAFVLWVAVLLMPTISSFLNYDIPLENTLVDLTGEVVDVNSRSPHIKIKLINGDLVEAEFPVQISFLYGVKTELFKPLMHKLVYACKSVSISGAYLKFVPTKRFRIWRFSCVNGAYSVTNNEIKAKWMEGRLISHVAGLAITIFILLLIVFVCYFNRESENGSES